MIRRIIEMNNCVQWPLVSLDYKVKIKVLSLQLFVLEKDPILKPKHIEVILELLKNIINNKESLSELGEVIV